MGRIIVPGEPKHVPNPDGRLYIPADKRVIYVVGMDDTSARRDEFMEAGADVFCQRPPYSLIEKYLSDSEIEPGSLVMVVDWCGPVRANITRQLQDLRFGITSYPCCEDALRDVRNAEHISQLPPLVLTHYRAPDDGGMTGLDFIGALRWTEAELIALQSAGKTE